MTRARLLVVEHDDIVALELQDRLAAMGYAVLEVVATGQDAVARAAALQPDLVLMDTRLRGALDGAEAAAEIRARLGLPVAYLTAYADDHTLAQAKVTEPNGLIISPFGERELEMVIELALYRHEMEHKLHECERLQAELLQAQEPDATGALAGGIAHDFSNLMTSVIGYSSLALSRLDDDDPLRPNLESIHRAGERAASLTEQLLALSRTERGQPQVLNLNEMLLEQEMALQNRLGDNLELRLVLEPGLSYVRVDPIQIMRAIVNLVDNACEALPSGGTVSLETCNLTASGDVTHDTFPSSSERCVCLSVTDSAVGMGEAIREQATEPSFTTRSRRMGPGLSIANGIVRQYEGWIDVVSEPGRGTSFRICLPEVFEDLVSDAALSRLAPWIQGRGERILLVEADATVRSTVGRMLRAGGYRVTAVGTVEHALYVFGRSSKAFDLLFCGVGLPDGDGLQLVADLRAGQPGLAVVISSDRDEEALQWSVTQAQGWQFLQKPYSLDSLLPAVHRALAAHQEGAE